MDRVAGRDHRNDLLGFARDQSDFAGVAQSHREQVLDVDVIHLLGRSIFYRDDDLPGVAHLGHAELRRRRRLVQQITSHEIDVFLGEIARGTPVRHAARRAVGDEIAKILVAVLTRDVGGQGLAGGALAQHAVATGAALEVDLVGAVELFLRHRGHTLFGAGDFKLAFFQDVQAGLVFSAGCGPVLLDVGGRRRLRAGRKRQAKRQDERQCERRQQRRLLLGNAKNHDLSPRTHGATPRCSAARRPALTSVKQGRGIGIDLGQGPPQGPG